MPGEALDSWLEAIAYRYQLPIGDVMARCGIEPRERTALRLVSPTGDEPRQIGTVCGIGGGEIRSMTMDHFGRRPVDGDRWPSFLWLRHAGSRFCPHCLRESAGRWLLGWRLNWSFACLTHHCLLADSCPVCASAQRRQALCPSRIPQPSRCRDADRCGADLGTADVRTFPHAHPVLAAQTTIQALLDGTQTGFALYGAAAPTCSTVMCDLRVLTQWVIHAVNQAQLDGHLPTDLSSAVARHRQSTSWPHGRHWRGARTVPSALGTAAGVSLALGVICLPNADAAVSTLRQLMHNAHNGGPYQTPMSHRAALSSALTAVIEAAVVADVADRKLRSRVARKLAGLAAVPAGSTPLPR
jgi:TniQ